MYKTTEQLTDEVLIKVAVKEKQKSMSRAEKWLSINTGLGAGMGLNGGRLVARNAHNLSPKIKALIAGLGLTSGAFFGAQTGVLGGAVHRAVAGPKHKVPKDRAKRMAQRALLTAGGLGLAGLAFRGGQGALIRALRRAGHDVPKLTRNAHIKRTARDLLSGGLLGAGYQYAKE